MSKSSFRSFIILVYNVVTWCKFLIKLCLKYYASLQQEEYWLHWTYWELEGDRVHTHCTEGGRCGGQGGSEGPNSKFWGFIWPWVQSEVTHISDLFSFEGRIIWFFSKKKQKTAVMKTKDWDQNQLIVSWRDTTVHVICWLEIVDLVLCCSLKSPIWFWNSDQ